jgi:four helix bundle protein
MNNISGKEAGFDLLERTFRFAADVRALVKRLPKTIANIEDSKQVVRASGSIGANYREACDALSKKDFVFRIKISRKEAKECGYWLKLIDPGSSEDLRNEQIRLAGESIELMKIFGSIFRKSTK